MNRCIYCNRWLETADTNNVCSACANERKGTYATTQPIILSRVDFSEKTPTVDELCKALSDYIGQNVYYESGYFLYRKEEFYNQPFIIAYKYKSGLVELTKNVLPPHLITMIGRFYESLEVKE